MLLQDVLDATQLRIRPLHLGPDTLSQPVNWTFTTDLLDPRRYLIRGQLVMTGLVWRRTPSDSETFVAAVARAGAVALMAGEGLYGTIPEDVLEACRRHDLPLLAVPADVSFASITAYISNAMANDRVTRVTASLTRQRQLLTDMYQGQLLDDLINRTSRELGRPIWMVTATGRPVVRALEPLPELDLDLIVSTALSSARLPAMITDSRGERLIIYAVGGLDDQRASSWFLIVAGDWNEWHPVILDTANELTAVAKLYRVQQSGRGEEGSALVDRLLSLLSEDPDQPETAIYLRQVGIEAGQRLVVVMAEILDHPEQPGLARWLVSDAIAQVGDPLVGSLADGRVVGLVRIESTEPGRPAEVQTIERGLRRVAPGLGDHVLRIGLSSVAGVGELGGALRSARYALSMPETDAETGVAVQIRDSTQVSSAVQLLAMTPDHLRQIFVEQTLQPVIDHDTRYNSQLVATLAAFLDCAGSWVRTAEVTHLHLNTVRYRIGRVEELTGRDLGSTADRADLYLALKLS